MSRKDDIEDKLCGLRTVMDTSTRHWERWMRLLEVSRSPEEFDDEQIAALESDYRSLHDDMVDERITTAIQNAGVPERYKQKSFASWEPDTANEKTITTLFNWSLEKEPVKTTALLTGPPGTGKSHLAAAVVRSWVSEKFPANWVTMPDLLRDMAASPFEVSGQMIQRTAGRWRLIIDDYLAAGGKLTTHAVEILAYLVSTRYDKMLPTLITTNASLDEIADLVDARTASRLSEGLVLKLEGKDRRL